jgi:hypothetical protein
VLGQRRSTLRSTGDRRPSAPPALVPRPTISPISQPACGRRCLCPTCLAGAAPRCVRQHWLSGRPSGVTVRSCSWPRLSPWSLGQWAERPCQMQYSRRTRLPTRPRSRSTSTTPVVTWPSTTRPKPGSTSSVPRRPFSERRRHRLPWQRTRRRPARPQRSTR